MNICIGDIVKDGAGNLGVVKLIDGVAVWISWFDSGNIDFESGFKLRVVSPVN